MRLVVINHITLDGVMQAPGRPDEDTRDGFRRGGWAAARNDEVMLEALGKRMGKPDGGLLLGRRSYEQLLASWYAQVGPYMDDRNNVPTHVHSSNHPKRHDWINS